MKHIPLCHKCADRQFRDSPHDAVNGVVPKVLVGCNCLSDADWREGWHPGDDGLLRQHKCPLMRTLQVEDEFPIK